MTDKEFVLSIYPDAEVMASLYGGFVIIRADCGWSTHSDYREETWPKAKKIILKKMLTKLEQ